MPSVLVVGAGIAGLSTAVALHEQGADVEVLEEAPAWRTEGFGLFTCANGLAAFDRLGVGDDFRARGVPIHRRRVVDTRGRVLLDVQERELWGGDAHSLGVTRPAVQEVLRAAASDVPVRFGTTVTHIDPRPGGVEVERSDGGEQVVDLLVGADGLRSATRRLLLGEPDRRVIHPRVARWLAPRPAGLDAWTGCFGPAGQLLGIPVDAETTYVYAKRDGDHVELSLDQWLAPFADYPAPFGGLVGDRTSEVSEGDMQEVAIPQTWGRGRAVLIGDAAHAMAPYMAQGGSLAVEDALAVARLCADGVADDAAARLTAARQQRTAHVQRCNHRRERVAALPAIVRRLGMKVGGRKAFINDLAPLSPVA